MQIYYKGVDILPDISVKQCFHDMYAEGHSDELLLRLEDYNRLWDTWNPQKGDEITVRSGAATTGKMYVSRIVPEGATIALHATPIPPEAKNRRNRSWEKVRFLQLFQDVAERYGFTLEQYGIDDHSYGYVNQSNITDLAFLQRRCVLEGGAFIIFDGKIVVYDEAAIEKGTPVKTLNVPVGMPFEYQNDTAKLYGSATITNGTMHGEWQGGSGERMLNQRVHVMMSNQTEANRFAKGYLRHANKYMVKSALPSETVIADIAPGSVVNLKTQGYTSWDGPAFVYRVWHEYMEGGSKVFFRPPLEGY